MYKIQKKQKKKTFPAGRWKRGLSNKNILSLSQKNEPSRGIPSKKIKEMSGWLKLQKKINNKMVRLHKLEDKAINTVITEADVICSTNSTAGSKLLKDKFLDVTVIDEATQATEPSTLIPLLRSCKTIMAGDPRQLPPTIINKKAKKLGLEKTIFERLTTIYPSHIKQMLQRQYRMNKQIMGFSNEKFYNNKLKAAQEVASHILRKAKNTGTEIQEICAPDKPVVFVDFTGKSFNTSRAEPELLSLSYSLTIEFSVVSSFFCNLAIVNL